MEKGRGRELRGTGRLRRANWGDCLFWSFCLGFVGKVVHHGAGVVLMEVKTILLGWCSHAGFVLRLSESGALPNDGKRIQLFWKILHPTNALRDHVLTPFLTPFPFGKSDHVEYDV